MEFCNGGAGVGILDGGLRGNAAKGLAIRALGPVWGKAAAVLENTAGGEAAGSGPRRTKATGSAAVGGRAAVGGPPRIADTGSGGRGCCAWLARRQRLAAEIYGTKPISGGVAPLAVEGLSDEGLSGWR